MGITDQVTRVDVAAYDAQHHRLDVCREAGDRACSPERVYTVATMTEAATIALRARSGLVTTPDGTERVRVAYVTLWCLLGDACLPPEVYVTPWGTHCRTVIPRGCTVIDTGALWDRVTS